MRFIMITDIHLGPVPLHNGISYIMGDQAQDVLSKIVSYEIGNSTPDFVVQLGDLIHECTTEVNLSLDWANLDIALKSLKGLGEPLFHVIGNHDAVNIPLPEVLKRFGLTSAYYSFVVSNVHLIVLNSTPSSPGKPIVIDETQMKWLESELTINNLPKIIFMHHSLADQTLNDNVWFDGKPELCLIQNRRDVREILEKTQRVLAVFNGHLHWDNITYHGSIPYITMRSCVDNLNLTGKPTYRYAVVELTSDFLIVDIKGSGAKQIKLELPKEARQNLE